MKKIIIALCCIALSAVSVYADAPDKISEIDKFHVTWRIAFVQPTFSSNSMDYPAGDKVGLLTGLDFQIPILKKMIHDYDGLGLVVGLHVSASLNDTHDLLLASSRIPLTLKYHVFKKGNYGVNLQFGPVIEYVIGTDEVPAKTIFANFMIGIGFNIGSTLIDFRYEWGGDYSSLSADHKLNRVFFGISF